MKKTLSFLILLSINFNIYSQEITEEERGFYTKILHGQDSVRFNKTTHYVFKFVEFDEKEFFKEVITQDEISSCNKLVKETAELKLNKEENQLVLAGKLTERFNSQTNGIFSIDLMKNKLTRENGEEFELNTFYNSHSGYGKIDFKTDIKSNFSNDEKIKGYVIFNLNYLIGYDKVELSSKDIDKEIILNNCNYTIVDIRDNELVLNKGCETEIELNVINFNNENKVAKPYAFMKLMEMAKKDSTIAMESFTRKNRETYKIVRDIFTENPTISLKEFKEIFTLSKLKEMKNIGKYSIVESIAPYGDKFIIFSPKFQSEEIKVTMK